MPYRSGVLAVPPDWLARAMEKLSRSYWARSD